jgi:HK97 family phage prohead protease
MPYSIEEGHEACDDGEVAVVKDSDGEVMGCHGTESDAQDQIAALEASEDERAEPEDLSEGTRVTWGPDNATRYGEIVSVVTSGETTSDTPGEGEATLEGSEDNPAYRIQHYEAGDGGWEESDSVTVHRADNLTVIEDFPARSASTARTGTPHHRAVTEAQIRQSGEENVVTVQFMTEQVARDGMVLDAEGLDTDAYERNPVVLWSHGTDPRRGGEPIARASNIRQGGDGMLADVTFAEDDFAQRIKRKVQEGFINAVSIGWRTEDIDRSGDAPTITESDMTEFSFVAVPADTDALVQERSEGEDLRHRIATIENQLEELRAQATATSPSEPVDAEGTLSESSDDDRDAAQEEDASAPTGTEQYVSLSTLKKLKAQQGRQWTREDIRTELKKILGMK